MFLMLENTDKAEGKGADVPKYAFTKETDANLACMTQNQNGGQTKIVPLVVFEDFAEYHKDEDRKKLEVALGKLTGEEKKLLGLTFPEK
jgi:hypothetical protein